MSVRVYEYGLLPPTLNAELVEQQLSLAHRYRNMLTEIERERRMKVREIMSSHEDMAPLQARIAELTTARDAARDAVKAQRAATRTRSESKEQRDSIKAINGQIKDVVLQIKSIRSAVAADPVVQLGLKAADEHARQRVRDERAKCGVYWGTYLLQEADADRARQESSMPKFEPYRGNGRISVQLQGGLELGGLWGLDTQIQIATVNPDAYDPAKPRGVRRRAGRTVLRIRVASLRAKPVWAEFPMIMHRPIPEGAIVKVGTVLRRRRDCVSWYWRLQLTVDTTACTAQRHPAPSRGAVALNLGFCVRPGGAIRSGFLLGSDGWSQEVLAVKSDLYRGKPMTDAERWRAEQWIANGLKKADDIRSIRGNNLNLMKAAFAPWCAKLGKPGCESGQTTKDQPGAALGPTRGTLELPADAGRSVAFEPEQPGEPGLHGLGQPAGAGHQLATAQERPDGSELDVRSGQGRNTTPEQPSALGRREQQDAREQPGIRDSHLSWNEDGEPQEQPAVAGPQEPVAGWFVESTKSAAQWLSAARFRGLSLRWERERFPGDEEGFEALRAWRERDEHLERYESGIRGSAIRDRMETYRIIAAQMARRYRTLVIDSTDLSKYQDGGEVEDDKRDHEAIRRNQQLAAGSLLRSALQNAFGPDRTTKLGPAKRTTTCHSCGVVNTWGRTGADRVHVCSSCGVQWDIDANFCRNLLKDWTDVLVSPPAAEEPKRPSRSQRLRQAAASKVEQDKAS